MGKHPDDTSYWAELGGLPAEPESPNGRDDLATTTCYICGQPGHYAIACPLHPARLRTIRGDACGPGPCTGACRRGDHNECGFHWCTCRCHGIALPAPGGIASPF